MNKPASLRAALAAALPDLVRDPERLLVFIDKGSVQSTFSGGLSWEYGYTLNIILTDYAGHPDAVILPLVQWVRINQSELLDNVDQRPNGITFEADILDAGKVDLSITLKLTERVVARVVGDRIELTHVPEPQPEEPLGAGHWQLWLRGHLGADDTLLAEWDQPA